MYLLGSLDPAKKIARLRYGESPIADEYRSCVETLTARSGHNLIIIVHIRDNRVHFLPFALRQCDLLGIFVYNHMPKRIYYEELQGHNPGRTRRRTFLYYGNRRLHTNGTTRHVAIHTYAETRGYAAHKRGTRVRCTSRIGIHVHGSRYRKAPDEVRSRRPSERFGTRP